LCRAGFWDFFFPAGSKTDHSRTPRPETCPVNLAHLLQMNGPARQTKAIVEAPIEIGLMPIGTPRIFNATGESR